MSRDLRLKILSPLILYKTKGFTLLEMLVVMLLIGIVLSFATLAVNVGNPEQLVREEAQRLQALLQLAQEEALLNNRVLGLSMNNQGYEFYILQNNAWTLLEDEHLQARDLSKTFELELEIEGVAVQLKNASKDQPQIAILPDGEITAFVCTFIQTETNIAYQLTVSLLGESHLEHLKEKI